MGRRLGLIIGINSYQDTAFRPLRYAETDARAIAQWLVNTQGGKWSPPDLQLVQGAYATHELVESLITQMCTQVAGPGDVVFIYFAGHAFLNEANGEGYLALSNTQYRQPSTGLHFASLAQQALGRSRAASIVFILDCFQTGSNWNRPRSSPFDSKPLLGAGVINGLQQMNDRLICCSCRGNERAPEAGEKSLGLLAYQMIIGLCGPAADPNTDQVTLQRLHAFLFNALPEQQRPQLFGQERYPLVLVGDMPSIPINPSPVASQPLPPLQPEWPPFTGFSSGMFSASPAQSMTNGSSVAQAAQHVTTDPLRSQPAQSVITGTLPSQSVQHLAATAQLSPSLLNISQNISQNSPSAIEQQSTMLLRQARHLVQMQNPAEAFNTIEQLLRISPTNVSALILKAQLLGTAGRSQEALFAVEQALRLDASNALAWSVQAALLTNSGQYQKAFQSVERSLELDPNNPETYSLKTNIMGQIAALQSAQNTPRARKGMPAGNSGGINSFAVGALVQFGGFAIGLTGALIPLFAPNLSILIIFALESLGLAMISVNSARGSYLYGFMRLFLALITSLIAAAILGAVYKLGLNHMIGLIQNNPPLLIPLLFSALWLALAAA
ncbi:MAG TPA: tetratricopeptide repeat protein, partial [Ktedonobacteraceae bacterium]|nr:tetratricopeptide repeat protein [Ktedonobacteraceae bacterium]